MKDRSDLCPLLSSQHSKHTYIHIIQTDTIIINWLIGKIREAIVKKTRQTLPIIELFIVQREENSKITIRE